MRPSARSLPSTAAAMLAVFGADGCSCGGCRAADKASTLLHLTPRGEA
ncbi:hypothetical protein [Deinococcus maricopensis]|nr:hypothetical protein [Deinococcus maricopensis]